MEVLKEIHNLMITSQPFYLCIVVHAVGSTPRSTGAKMIVLPNGKIIGSIGGGAVEKRIVDMVLTQRAFNEATMVSFDLEKDLGMKCGGQMSLYVEPVGNLPKLHIFGAGHIGKALAPLANNIGYAVTVVDERPAFADHSRFPTQVEVVCSHPVSYIENHQFSECDSIVIITHRHVHDKIILQHLAERTFQYVGMIGSERKVKQIFEQLQAKGISEKWLKHIHAPIGFKVKAETPCEIATLIAAELIVSRRRKE